MLNLHHPEVRRFYRAAVAHLDAASALLSQCPEVVASTRGHEVVYLCGYVIECSFKALLLSRTPLKKHQESISWFKRVLKHDLDLLKRELSRNGIDIPKAYAQDFNRVRSNWLSEMRYEVRRWRRNDVQLVLESVRRVFAWVKGD